MSQGFASAGTSAQDQGLRQTVIFTADGTFSKATYPWLKRIRVTCIGSGGGGGGAAATTTSEVSGGGGGGGGAFAQSVIEVGALASSETVTVGVGGVGGTGAIGVIGEDTSFGTLVVADAGLGGDYMVPRTAVPFGSDGGLGGLASNSTGDIKQNGQRGGALSVHTPIRAWWHTGGGNQYSPGQNAQFSGSGSASGDAGAAYGGGGGGTWVSANQIATTGGTGADGIVIVDLYG